MTLNKPLRLRSVWDENFLLKLPFGLFGWDNICKKPFISHGQYVPHHPPIPGTPLGVLPWVGAPSLHPKAPRASWGSQVAEQRPRMPSRGKMWVGVGPPGPVLPLPQAGVGTPSHPLSLDKCPLSSLGCSHGTGASPKPIQHIL